MARMRGPKDWKLWTLTVPALAYVLAVDAAAAGYLAWLYGGISSSAGLTTVVALTGSALIAVEGARRVEHRRRKGGGALHKDLAPAWILAGAIALQPAMAVVVALVLRIWWRIRAGRCIPYRWVFSSAAIVLAIGAAHVAYTRSASWLGTDGIGQLAAMCVGAAAYLIVEGVLCGVCILLMQPGSSRRDAFGGLDEVAVDTTAVALGCLIAAAAQVNPWAVTFAIPIALTAQRALLLRQFESAAQTDSKTGLDRLGWWREQAADLLARAGDEPVAVLLIDIDHFKNINDEHGHLVGDEALRAVSTILRGAIRSKDVIGRFGGEEFVIALPATPEADARATADRLRTAVAGSPLAAMLAGVLDDPSLEPATLQLTVSIGVAVSPRDGTTLDGLLAAADRAMYAAKLAGRDRVECAQPPRRLTPVETRESA